MALSDDDVRRIADASARQVALYRDERLDSRDARQMWDDAASPHHVWQQRQHADGPDAWAYLTGTAAEVTALRAAVGELARALGELNEGLDADDLVARIDHAIASGARTITDQLEGMTLRLDTEGTTT